MEYKIFQKTFSMSPGERLKYRGRCRLRMMNEKGVYQYIDNLVQIMQNTPAGNVWLIFCLYSYLPTNGRNKAFMHDNPDGTWGSRNIIPFGRAPQYPFRTRKGKYCAAYGKGLSSKEIAATLYISVNTVNRHRQNILEKLSVGNSIEACRAAELMKLL